MNKFYLLEDIEDFANTTSDYFQPVISPTTYTGANVPVYQPWSEEDFEEYYEKVNERSLFIKKTDDPWGKFKQLYTNWIARNGGYMANQIYALTQKYNPIENYNRHEVHSGKDTQVKTPDEWKTEKTETPDNFKETTLITPTNWQTSETQVPTNWKTEDEKTFTNRKDVDTQTPDEWKKTVKQVNDENQNESGTTHSVIPFNGSTFEDASRDLTTTQTETTEEQTGTFATEKEYLGSEKNTKTQTGSYQTTTEQSGTYKTEVSASGSRSESTVQSGTFTDETTHGHTIDISGNIGVTSTQDMIKQTLELYDRDFAERWIKRFFDSCTVYI